MVPGLTPLLLSGLLVQLDSCWLPIHEYHLLYLYVISLWIAWSWGSQRPPKQHSSFESVNLINLINKNQGSGIHVKIWQIREAEEQPQLLPTSLQFLQPKEVRSCLNPALPRTSIYSPPNLSTHQLVTVSILWLQASFIRQNTRNILHNHHVPWLLTKTWQHALLVMILQVGSSFIIHLCPNNA